MKKLIFIFVSALLFMSCGDNVLNDGRKLYKAYLNKFMKDPASLVIYNESYQKDGLVIDWEIDYGGRNGFGGMSRETLKVRTIDGKLLITDEGRYKIEDLQ